MIWQASSALLPNPGGILRTHSVGRGMSQFPKELGHGMLLTIFPLGNVRELGYYPTSDCPFFFALHLGMEGLKVPTPQVLDREKLNRP